MESLVSANGLEMEKDKIDAQVEILPLLSGLPIQLFAD